MQCEKLYVLGTEDKNSVVSVDGACGRQAGAVGVDEIAFPQAAEGLVAGDVVVVVEVGQDFLEVFCAFGFGGAPEPELEACWISGVCLDFSDFRLDGFTYLAENDFQAFELVVFLLEGSYVGFDVGFEGRDGLVDVHV